MAGVDATFFLGALEADFLALFVRGACDSVFHFAAEARHAAEGLGWACGCCCSGTRGIVVAVVVVVELAVVFAAFGLDVGVAGDFEETLDPCSFGGGEAVEVFLVVVGVVPD